jgi:hypothetical protein
MQGNQLLTYRNFWLTCELCLIELCNTKTLLGDLPPKALRKCNWFAKETTQPSAANAKSSISTGMKNRISSQGTGQTMKTE